MRWRPPAVAGIVRMLTKFDVGRGLTCQPPALLPISTVEYTSSHSSFSGSSSALSRETVNGSAPAVDQNGRHRAQRLRLTDERWSSQLEEMAFLLAVIDVIQGDIVDQGHSRRKE